jgi:hypothetical protein
MSDFIGVKAPGKKLWVIPGGHIPLATTGPEPEFTSCDQVSVLNGGGRMAIIVITVYYADREPVGPVFPYPGAAARLFRPVQ